MNRSRRRFLKGAGTAGIAALGGLSMTGTVAAGSYTIDSDLRQTVDITGGDLDAAVDAISPGSPLIGLGDTWVAVQNERDINAVYMAAHAALESAWGRSSIAQAKNNIYGFDARDICPAECANGYASFEQCVREVMAYVDTEYLTPGGDWYEGTTLRAMNVHYATDQQWAEKIASIMNDLAAELPAGSGGGGGGGGDSDDDGSSGDGFSDGQQVQSTVDLNTRYRPGLESRVLDTQPTGTTGEIMNGPVSEDGYTWWGVHWSDDVWGWSVERYLDGTGTGGSGDSGFSDGERVTPTANLNTRYRPGTESRVLDTMAPGTVGEVMNGPVSEDGYTWRGVHWLDADIWGWSAGEYLKSTGSGDGSDGDDGDGGGDSGDKPPVQYDQAATGNYEPADRTAGDIRWAIIHTIEGSYEGGISVFNNPDSGVSAHYVVGNESGQMTQMVDDSDIAYTAGNYDYNVAGMNFENEGYASEGHPDSLYQNAADIVSWVCEEYGIPKEHPSGVTPANPTDGGGVIGHEQVPDPENPSLGGGINNHTDPGDGWDWEYFMSLL
ncbi:MAG TPA: N-acetylmuramoyl-L-alanine amidase [Halococcus sp.]|nr:N-acetylmuramoyl-L-alanine amidase [Halococcus sp.]